MNNKEAIHPATELDMCCGVGCNKEVLEADFKLLQDDLKAANIEIARLNRLLIGWVEEWV